MCMGSLLLLYQSTETKTRYIQSKDAFVDRWNFSSTVQPIISSCWLLLGNQAARVVSDPHHRPLGPNIVPRRPRRPPSTSENHKVRITIRGAVKLRRRGGGGGGKTFTRKNVQERAWEKWFIIADKTETQGNWLTECGAEARRIPSRITTPWTVVGRRHIFYMINYGSLVWTNKPF